LQAVTDQLVQSLNDESYACFKKWASLQSIGTQHSGTGKCSLGHSAAELEDLGHNILLWRKLKNLRRSQCLHRKGDWLPVSWH